MATAIELVRLEAVVPFAQAAQRKWGVPASVSLAQWTFESSWGEDAPGNNCFGIKAVGGQQYTECVTTEDYADHDEKQKAHFASYASVGDSFDMHGRLLATSHYYITAMRALPSITGFCAGLQSGGYSTSRDPKTRQLNYAQKLLGQIAHYNLTRYDTLPPNTPAQEAA